MTDGIPSVVQVLETALYCDDLARTAKFYRDIFGLEALVDRWIDHLGSHGVELDGRTTWERGGTSLYFRDPDNHSVELVTPKTWRTY